MKIQTLIIIYISLDIFSLLGTHCDSSPAKNKREKKEVVEQNGEPNIDSKQSIEWKCPIEILPGESIGPIKINMEKADVHRLGAIKKGIHSEKLRAGGEYLISYKNEKVDDVLVVIDDAPDKCFRIRNRELPGLPKEINQAKQSGDLGKLKEEYDKYFYGILNYFQGCSDSLPETNAGGKPLVRSGGPIMICEKGGLYVNAYYSGLHLAVGVSKTVSPQTKKETPPE